MRSAVPVAIALGSNLGDRASSLRAALLAISGIVGSLRASTFYSTEPVGVGHQPEFLNAAAVGETQLPAASLLQRLLDVETSLGRERPHAGAPRTIDLDLILYGDAVISEPWLTVPHPRFRERWFVLKPLSEIAGEWRDPVTGRTIGELLRALRPQGSQ